MQGKLLFKINSALRRMGYYLPQNVLNLTHNLFYIWGKVILHLHNTFHYVLFIKMHVQPSTHQSKDRKKNPHAPFRLLGLFKGLNNMQKKDIYCKCDMSYDFSGNFWISFSLKKYKHYFDVIFFWSLYQTSMFPYIWRIWFVALGHIVISIIFRLLAQPHWQINQ